MLTNKLKLNPDKTEFLLIGNERRQSIYLSTFPIELFGVKTNPAKSARNLGVILDKNFTFRSHIFTYSSYIYHIRNLRWIHRHLHLENAKLLANALMSIWLDYCISLLSGIADTDFAKLHRILNPLNHVVEESPPSTRSVPLLRSPYWLPVKYSLIQDLFADL